MSIKSLAWVLTVVTVFAVTACQSPRGKPVPPDWPRASAPPRAPVTPGSQEADRRPPPPPAPVPAPAPSRPDQRTEYETPQPPPGILSLDVQNRIGPLPARKLEVGTCGLFLYARIPRARLVFFSLGFDGDAEMIIRGEKVSMSRVQAEGNSMFGHFERQRFQGEGIDVLVNAEMERQTGVLQGAVAKRGNIRVRDRDGWSFVLPVAGLIACQDERSAKESARSGGSSRRSANCPVGWSCE